jgi:hypothetical protein
MKVCCGVRLQTTTYVIGLVIPGTSGPLGWLHTRFQ